MSDGLTVEPDDAFNRELVRQVHPPGWVNPEPAERYNLVVIGAGTAGLVCAAGAAGLGARVALVERHLMGGDCLNFGCVPSKGLLRAARAVGAVRRAEEFGVRLPGAAEADFGAAMERMRRLRAGISKHDSAARFRELGVDVFLGDGMFADAQTVRVGEQALRFKKAVIATGARAAALPIPGLEAAGFLTNETVFSLTERPARLAVIGGGPIGCELAQAFARFGTRVTVFEQSSHVLGREDADAAAIVQRALTADGVELVTSCQIVRVDAVDGGRRLTYRAGETEAACEVDQILVAAGRAPNVEGLGLDAIGVAYDERTGVQVNDRLQTTLPQIFAAGDVCFPYKFTHAADFLARIVLRNALFPFGRAKASALTIPWCTYTEPEIAHVGLSEQTAADQGVAVDVLVQRLEGVDRAILDGETEGFVKVLLRKGSDRIVGGTIVAPHAGEMIGELTLAMTAGIGLGTIGNTIHPYPTQSEAIRKLGDQYARSRLTPWVKAAFARWLRWTR